MTYPDKPQHLWTPEECAAAAQEAHRNRPQYGPDFTPSHVARAEMKTGTLNSNANLIPPGSAIKAAIISELYKALERLDADPELLSIIGSYGDTLTDEEVLRLLRAWNETGKVVHEAH